MRLKTDVSVDRVLTELKGGVDALKNAASLGGAAPDIRKRYIEAIDNLERQFRTLFDTEKEIAELYTDRYWRIFGLEHSDYFGAHHILRAEIDAQVERLRAMIATIEEYLPLRNRQGQELAILDTNVLMHCRLFDTLPWSKIFGVSKVRLVIPLAILDELDEKSYSGNKRLSKRASKVLHRLTPYLDDIEKMGIAAIDSSGADTLLTLEILGEDKDHQRPGNMDLEIINRSRFLQAVANRPVTVVTSDRGMRVRAKARHLTVITLDEEYRLPLEEEDESGNNA